MVRTVPHDFIGPLRPGTIRLPSPKRFAGQVRPGTECEKLRRTGREGHGSSEAGAAREDEFGSRESQRVEQAVEGIWHQKDRA